MFMRNAIAACLALALTAGCGGGPKLVTVTGTVTENGAPLSDAAVMFNPIDGTDARPAEDVTGPQGNYRLRTGGRTGIAPGKYRVVVIKAPAASAAAAADPAFQDDPFMAELSTAAPTTKKKAQKSIEHSEDREITDEPTQVQDIDVKSDVVEASSAS